MPYLRLQVLLLIIFCVLLISSVVVFSQRQRPTVQVGTPRCTPHTEESGVECRDLSCAYGTISTSQECTPDPAFQKGHLCQNVPSGCANVTPIGCSTDNTRAAYSYQCDDLVRVVQATIVCPVTCYKYCPTPEGRQPCRQATWDTTYCEWNTSKCQLAENCTTAGWDGSCPPGTYPDGGMCCDDGRGDGFTTTNTDASASIAPGNNIQAEPERRRAEIFLTARSDGRIAHVVPRSTSVDGSLTDPVNLTLINQLSAPPRRAKCSQRHNEEC
jgi:hypothetical protein